jgi:DNA-binding NarL/FixJ family response regulator
MSALIRVMLVDDHALFTAGLREILAFYDDIDVIATVESGDRALVEVARLSPEVVLMDLQMPGLDGVTATRRIIAHHAATAVLALTMYDDDASVFAVLRAGARGYVLKGARQDELIAAIRAVARGEAVFGARVADRVLAYFAAPRPAGPPLPELTGREREGPAPAGHRVAHNSHRLPARPGAEDRPQPPVRRLRETSSRRPRPSRTSSERGWPG